jgi:hypothetical protein
MICISNVFFINNPDPKFRSKEDPEDPKKIISVPQHHTGFGALFTPGSEITFFSDPGSNPYF